MIFRITVGGNDFSNDVTNLDQFQIEYSLDQDTKTLSYKTSNEILFTGAAYDYFRNEFFDDPLGHLKTIDAVVTVNCCDKYTYRFTITSESLNDCVDACTMGVTLIANNESIICFNKLKTEIFWRPIKSLISNRQYFVPIPYAQDVDIWRNILRWLWIIVRSIPLITFIDLVNDLFSDGNNFIRRTEDWLVGCGFYGIGINIPRAVEFNAKNCDLEFKSTILQSSSYINTYIWSQQYNKGKRVQNQANADLEELLEENGENFSTLQLLDSLQPVFNAEYRIFNGELRFEQRSWFKQNTPRFIDIDQAAKDGLTEGVCYQYVQGRLYASANMRFNDDTLDGTGRRRKDFFNTRFEYNSPPNKAQRDIYEPTIEYGNTAFMDDFYSEIEIDNLRRSSRPNPFGWGNQYIDIPVVENGYIGSPRLLNVTGVNPTRYQKEIFFNNNWFNRALTFNDFDTNNLYDRFHRFVNPREFNQDRWQIENVEVALSCELLDVLDQHGLNVHIKTRYGNGLAETIKVDFATQKITIQNILI